LTPTSEQLDLLARQAAAEMVDVRAYPRLLEQHALAP
jgi:hypothetical protein